METVFSTDLAGSNEDYVHWLDRLWSQRLLKNREHKADLSIGILLWPSFPMMSLTGIMEPLRHAGDFADNSRPIHCRWSIMGERGHVAVASCGIRVTADSTYINPTDFDYIAVIGGLLPHLRVAPSRHRDYLRVAASAGVPLIGLCTGSFVLAQEGLLEGCRASVHPFHAEEFRSTFPRIAVSTRDDFISERSRITVPGGISILSLMTDLVRTHCGADRAAKAVHQLSLAAHRGMSEFDRSRATVFRQVADSRIQRAVVLIESRKGRDVTPEMVSDIIGLSARQFTRLFREHLGLTPKKFILDTRLRYARFLLENSTMSITTIAFETGFSDGAHLATAFKARYNISPGSLRK